MVAVSGLLALLLSSGSSSHAAAVHQCNVFCPEDAQLVVYFSHTTTAEQLGTIAFEQVAKITRRHVPHYDVSVDYPRKFIAIRWSNEEPIEPERSRLITKLKANGSVTKVVRRRR